MEKKKKLRVGFYGITGCAGCQLSVLFNEDEILSLFDVVDITAFPFIRERNIDQDFDFVFIEGLVASEGDLETAKKLREKAKVLVALGACAHTGCVPAYRNFTLKENYEHLLYAKDKGMGDIDPSPVDAHIKVDYTIPGCPPDKNEILSFIKDIAAGKEPKPYNNPVCIECRRNNNLCLLEIGRPCLGPVTRGGCNAVCINGGFECWGCRGQTDDANIPTMVRLLEGKGHSREFIRNRMRAFVGLKLPKETEDFFNAGNNKP
jgi:sulfhydrogenase subunit delta